MSAAVTFPASVRAAYVARIAQNLRNARVPGGDVAAWVAPLPTATLAEILVRPRERTLEMLFTALAYHRGIVPPGDVHAAIEAAPPENVARSYYAEIARIAWRGVAVARDDLEAGHPDLAQRTLHALTRWLHEWPTPLARRFEPRIEALYAEATRMRERHLADEVA